MEPDMLTTFASGSISTSFVFLRPIVVLSDRMQLYGSMFREHVADRRAIP